MPTRPLSHAATKPLSPMAKRLLGRAQAELRNGDSAAAERTLNSALSLVPGNVDVVRWLGVAAQMNGHREVAMDCFRQALAVWPNDSSLYVRLGIAQFELGEAGDAILNLRRACELDPGAASAWFNLGEALKQQGLAEEAADVLQRALKLEPAHVSARLSLARVRASMGWVDDAVREFRTVLQGDPDNARAWFGLSNLNTVRFNATDAEHVRGAWKRSAVGSEANDLLGFALAKALEDMGDYGAAFEQFRIANASQRRRVKWDTAGEHRRVEAILRVFGAWRPPQALDPTMGREVILIVSIPRSGSSLVEQILASHPEVEGANEIKDMAKVIDAETR
ncbi:MAG: tetratricopeptide repeat protein, partial [Rhodanobacteraceae bacterium]